MRLAHEVCATTNIFTCMDINCNKYFLDIDKSIEEPLVGVREAQEGCLVQGLEDRLIRRCDLSRFHCEVVIKVAGVRLRLMCVQE